MELAGNEKKIQALFRELKLADERVAPEFKRVWNRARAPSPGSSRAFKLPLAVATTLFVITLASLGLWSRNGQRSQPSNSSVASEPATAGSTPAPPSVKTGPTYPGATGPSDRVKSIRWDRRVVARRHADFNARTAAVREAVAISTWQSPTARLMQSPADNVLMSLPQLDRSLTELKTFLPNTPQ